MSGTRAQRVLEISSALERCASRIEQHSRDCWSLVLSDGADLQATALIDESWLLLDAPLPASRATNHKSRLWQLLQWNGTLPGGAKFTVRPDGTTIHTRAELPLNDDANLPRRVVQACAGLKAASAKYQCSEFRSPCPLGEPVPSTRSGRALSLVEGGPGEGMQWMAAKDDGAPNGEFVECNPAADLAAQCRESGWAFAERSGKLVVDLEVPDAFQQAVVEAKPHAVAVSVDVATSSEPLAMPCQEALALLLLRTCGIVRMVRAAAGDVGSGTTGRFQVLFGDTPSGAELGHAFSALSVACRMASREATVLQYDETIARAYLKSVSRGSWIATPRSDHGE